MSLPRVIGRYSIYDEIAAGGMATVHFGRLLAEGGFSRTVAIKRLHPKYARDPDFVTMFLDEARLASRVRHSNVVTTLDVVSEGDEVLLVMEYIAGESLARLLRAVRPNVIPMPVVLTIMTAVLHGLHAAHVAKTEQGQPLELVHRDISPQNILVGTDGIARVLDFGVAKASHRAQTTREGELKGKLSYMAPEQLRRDGIDRRSDIYAASIVLWECLTGARLFDGESEARVVTKVLSETVAAPSSRVESLPALLDAVVLRGLARESEDRFATAREMAVALEQCGIVHASTSQVRECVEALATEQLSKRASRLAEIERTSDQRLSTSANVRASQRLPVMPVPLSAFDPDSVPTSVLYATTTSVPRLSPPRGKLLAIAAVAAILGIGFVVLAFSAKGRDTTAATPPLTAVEPVVLAVPTPPPASVTIAPLPSSSTIVSAAPPAASAPRPVATPRPPRADPPLAQPPRPDICKIPYTVDANGIRHLKPECL